MFWWPRGIPGLTPPVSESELADAAGSRNAAVEYKKEIKKIRPRCIFCKRFIGFKTGVHIFFTEQDRAHIPCFCKKVDKLIEDGTIEEARRKEEGETT
jgi:hypothetical protein